jgi:hypothetical protein
LVTRVNPDAEKQVAWTGKDPAEAAVSRFTARKKTSNTVCAVQKQNVLKLHG